MAGAEISMVYNICDKDVISAGIFCYVISLYTCSRFCKAPYKVL